MAGFIKRITIHCYTQNMKAVGLVVSEKNTFLCFFFHDTTGAGPVWTPGAWLAGFIKGRYQGVTWKITCADQISIISHRLRCARCPILTPEDIDLCFTGN